MAHYQFVPRSRREALRAMGAGFGMTALASMTGTSALAAPGDPANPWSVKQPHFPPKAKHVILVFLTGGLSSIDSFDRKPLLDKYGLTSTTGSHCPTRRPGPSSQPAI